MRRCALAVGLIGSVATSLAAPAVGAVPVRSHAAVAPRIAVITTDGTAFVKQGGFSAPWVRIGTHVAMIALSGERIGVVTDAGAALVKTGGLHAPWRQVATHASSIALSGTRIAVVSRSGNGRIKDGKITAPWARTVAPVRQLALAAKRIGWVRANGVAYAADDLTKRALRQAPNARRLVLSGDRIAVLDSRAQVGVKAGTLYSDWVRQTGRRTPLLAVALSGTRIGVVTVDDRLLVKVGGLRAPFAELKRAGAATAVAMSGNRIAVVRTDHTVVVQQGGVHAPWVQLRRDVAAVVLPTP